MKNIELLSRWINEDSKLEIGTVYGEDGFYYRINKEKLNIEGLSFLEDPLSLCKEAASLLDIEDRKLDFPIVGRVTVCGNKILFQYFPDWHRFSVIFSLFSDEKLARETFNGKTFEEKIYDILGPGWHYTDEDRLAKFELLLDKYQVEAINVLDIVKEILSELDREIRSEPANAGGSHNSDHYEWHSGGFRACKSILKRYER